MIPIFRKRKNADIAQSLTKIVSQTMGNDLVSLILFGHTGQDLTADNADPIRILIVLAVSYTHLTLPTILLV